MASTNFPDDDLPLDEDVHFEREKESKIEPNTQEGDAEIQSNPAGETILPPKEDTLGKSDFPPLSDAEKQPKLEDDLTIKPGGTE